MAVSQRGRNLARVPDRPTKPDFMSEINSSAVEAKLSARDCQALVATIRATDGWFAQQVGDLHHRYVFCWRWKEPQMGPRAVSCVTALGFSNAGRAREGSPLRQRRAVRTSTLRNS